MRERLRRGNTKISLVVVVVVVVVIVVVVFVVRFARRLTDLDLPLLLDGDEKEETRALIFRYALA